MNDGVFYAALLNNIILLSFYKSYILFISILLIYVTILLIIPYS